MRILFIGGNGNISWHCASVAQRHGHDVWILNRGQTLKGRRSCPEGATQLYADMRDACSVQNVLKGLTFDVIADFICHTPEQAHIDIELFRDRTKQFIFVSSAGIYQKPCVYPIVETNPLYDPTKSFKWEYAENKMACECVFLHHHKKEDFPVTIVRPAHTYDTIIPEAVGTCDWTGAKRILEGKPIVLAGDGTTLWTVTHSEDFANAFICLCGNLSVIGETFHITSDEWLTWRQISEYVASTLGAPTPSFVYVPSETIARLNPALGKGLLGHKTWCDIYDNSKIKSVAKNWKANIKFEDGIKRTVAWLQEDTGRQRLNAEIDLLLDTLCKGVL